MRVANEDHEGSLDRHIDECYVSLYVRHIALSVLHLASLASIG